MGGAPERVRVLPKERWLDETGSVLAPSTGRRLRGARQLGLPDRQVSVRRLPSALERWAQIAARLANRRVAVFVDYDGTLAPIAGTPDGAVLPEETRSVLRRLASVCPTTVVSGRGRADVEARVGMPELGYAGSHGFDIVAPGGGKVRLRVRPELEALVGEAVEELRRRTAGVEGVLVENKALSAALHYRLVEETRIPRLRRIVKDTLAGRPELRLAEGKKVFELRPAVEWDKGHAVLWLMEELGLRAAGAVPVYLGDDLTDEDAFLALREIGIGVLVADAPRATGARFGLADTGEVREFLARLASVASLRSTRDGA